MTKTYNGFVRTDRTMAGTPSSTGDGHHNEGNNNRDNWNARNNNNRNNNNKKKFVGESKSTEMKGKVVTQDGGNKSFNETKDALATFVNKKCPELAYNIKEMVVVTKDEIVKTKLDYSGCKTTDSTGTVTTDEDMKSEVHDTWKADHSEEMLEWRTYNTASLMAINEFEYQVEDAVLIEAKKNKNYKIAHSTKNVILLLETIQNVVNKGEYGGKRDVVVTNLDLTRVFLKWKQYEEDVPSFAKAVKQKYESLVANVGNMPFGENMMLAIMFSEQNKNVSGGSPIEVTMSDYYDRTVEERKAWNETYMC